MTWPPSAAVRQTRIAPITLSWPRLSRWRARKASPCRFRISATSSGGRAMSGAGPLWWWRRRQQGERAWHLAQRPECDAGIDGGGVELPVAEQDLDHADIGLPF